MATPAEWSASAPGRSAADGPWVETELAGAETDRPVPPLARLRVLDLTRVIAGPTATGFLALLGAEVLRLDPPRLPELPDQHLDRDAGKRSALADLADPGDLARVHALLGEADVLVTGYRPGAMGRFGLDAPTVRTRHPHVVVIELDAWGSGPWDDRRGFDSIVQAACGIAHRYGGAGEDGARRPGALPVQALDHATGYLMAGAALALLARRRRTGRAGSARFSLARTASRLSGMPAPDGADPQEPVPVLQTVESVHGTLRQAVAPVLRGSRTLPPPAPPGRYGADRPEWLPGGR